MRSADPAGVDIFCNFLFFPKCILNEDNLLEVLSRVAVLSRQQGLSAGGIASIVGILRRAADTGSTDQEVHNKLRIT